MLSSMPQPTVTILSYAGSVCLHCNSSLNCLQIAVYRAAWRSCFKTSFFPHIMQIFRIPKFSTKVDKAYLNKPHNVRQSTDYWAPPEITHNLRHKLRQAQSQRNRFPAAGSHRKLRQESSMLPCLKQRGNVTNESFSSAAPWETRPNANETVRRLLPGDLQEPIKSP
jgi:hypothetical protein